MPTYKESKTFAQRRAESVKYRGKYPPLKIPVVFEPRPCEGQLPQIHWRMQAVREGTSMSSFADLIRRQLQLRNDQMIFFTLPDVDVSDIDCAWRFGELYENYEDDDGFLYLNYYAE